MFSRTVRSAAVASWLLAANLVVLTLYLNPEVTLLGEATALFLSLFLPYALLGTAAFLVFTLFHAAFRFGPRPGSLLRGWPWLGSFLSLAVTATSAAYGFNLLSYRHSIPVDSLRALAASAAAAALALLVLLAVGLDTLLFPRRGRSLSAALVVLAPPAPEPPGARVPRSCHLGAPRHPHRHRWPGAGLSPGRGGSWQPAGFRAPAAARRFRAPGHPPPDGGPADLDHRGDRPPPPRPRRQELRDLSAARLQPDLRAPAQGGARGPAGEGEPRLDPPGHLHLAPPPRALERALRLRRPGGGGAPLGHLPSRARSGLHPLELLPPVPGRQGAGRGDAPAAGPAAGGSGPRGAERRGGSGAPRRVRGHGRLRSSRRPLAPGARRSGARPGPHVPSGRPRPAGGLRPAVLRLVLLRPRRGGPRLLPLRAPRAFRRRVGRRVAALPPRPRPLRGPARPVGRGVGPGPAPGGGADRGLRLRHGAGAAVAAPPRRPHGWIELLRYP